MTAHSEDRDACIGIAHCVMNKVMAGMGGGITDTMPALQGEEKEKFFKILGGNLNKHTENEFKKNLIIASAVMNGRIEDNTDGADLFSKDKTPRSKNIGDLYFSKSQAGGVIPEPKLPSKRRKKKEMYA